MNIKELAEQAALGFEYDAHPKCFERFAALVREDEREACAKLCDAECNKEDPIKIIGTYESGCYLTAEFLANEIRSRK